MLLEEEQIRELLKESLQKTLKYSHQGKDDFCMQSFGEVIAYMKVLNLKDNPIWRMLNPGSVSGCAEVLEMLEEGEL